MRLPFSGRGAGSSGSNGVSYQVIEVIGASTKNLDDAVERAAQRIAERRRTARSLPGIDLIGLALLGAAAGAAYSAARALLDRDASSLRLPDPLKAAASGASGELRQARTAVEAGIVEARRTREVAERELRDDYLARSGRGPRAAEPDA